ncbi:MAG: M48 family metalloprotease [Flavobacteriales bacterium]|nr:M48 family metalloprotease [Flavobacteriales bacterium]
MRHCLFIPLILLSFFTSVGQELKEFKEIPIDLASIFVSPKTIAEEVITTLDIDLTRSEGFVVNKLIKNGSYATRSLNTSGEVILNCTANAYLNKLKDLLLTNYPEVKDLITVYITKDASLNAFATVNNNIYINIGLLAAVENEAQLAYVMCHEIMHIVNSHSIKTSLEITRELSSFSAKDILVKSEVIKLHRHSISRDHETESDTDGLALYLQQKYDAKEALNALLMLKEYSRVSDIRASKELFFADAELYAKMLQNILPNDSIPIEKDSAIADEYLTHPLIDDRLKHIKSEIAASKKRNGTKQYLVSQASFTSIHKEALTTIPSLLVDKNNFIELFLSASKAYQLKDKSDNNVKHLCYAVQGLYLQTIKSKSFGVQTGSCKADSIFYDFVFNTSQKEVFSWAYKTLKTLRDDNKNVAVIDEYLVALSTNMRNMMNEEIAKEVLNEADFKILSAISKKPHGLSMDSIDFNVYPFINLPKSYRKQGNTHMGLDRELYGKTAILNLSNIKIHLKKLGTDAAVLTAATEALNAKAEKASLFLEEDHPYDVISLVPNPIKYDTEKYEMCVVFKKFLQRRIYFEDFEYVDIYRKQVDAAMKKQNVQYAMTSTNIEIKAVNTSRILSLVYTGGLLITAFPQVIANLVLDNSRKYMLTIIYDLETGDLIFWDKRTSMEPSTSSQLYANYNNILSNFLKP